MTWQATTITVLRNIIGDNILTYTYSDADLTSVMFSASYIINNSVSFSNTYTINTETEVISPTPESDFISLIVLKTTAIILQNEYRIASNKAMMIWDGPSRIDARGLADTKRLLAKDASDKYDRAEFLYNAHDYSKFKAIVGPFNFSETGSYSEGYDRSNYN